MSNLTKFMLLALVLSQSACVIDEGSGWRNVDSSNYSKKKKKPDCGPVDVILYYEDDRQRSEQVDIYFDQADIPYEIRKIASLTTEGGGRTKESDLVARIRCKAFELGADGIICSRDQYESGKLPVSLGKNKLLINLKKRVIRAEAVIYLSRK